jgi:hypothetical protein
LTYYSNGNADNVTVTTLVDPDKLVIDAYIVVVGTTSLLNPIAPGVINCVAAPDVIISAITPDPGVGSVPCALDESDVRLVASVYNLTQAPTLVCIEYNK